MESLILVTGSTGDPVFPAGMYFKNELLFSRFLVQSENITGRITESGS